MPLEAVITDAWDNIDNKSASIEVAGSRTIDADRTRLLRALENLYRDAIDHVGPEVTVTVGRRTTGSTLPMRAGVPTDAVDKIFGTAARRARRNIGLSIANGHQGGPTIGATSNDLPDGAMFVFAACSPRTAGLERPLYDVAHNIAKKEVHMVDGEDALSILGRHFSRRTADGTRDNDRHAHLGRAKRGDRPSTATDRPERPADPSAVRRARGVVRGGPPRVPVAATDDPYEILVSEVMSQQTQLGRVVEAWEAFLDRWPTAAATGRGRPVVRGGLLDQSLAGIQQPREVSPRGRTVKWSRTTTASSPGRRTASGVDGRRPLHRQRGRLLRVQQRRRGGRHQRQAGAAPRLRGPRRRRGVRSRRLGTHARRQSRVWNNAIMELGGVACEKTPDCDGAQCPWREWCSAYETGDFTAPDVPTQPEFEGSRRQMRGRVISALKEYDDLRLDELGPRVRVDYAPEGESAGSGSAACWTTLRTTAWSMSRSATARRSRVSSADREWHAT